MFREPASPVFAQLCPVTCGLPQLAEGESAVAAGVSCRLAVIRVPPLDE